MFKYVQQNKKIQTNILATRVCNFCFNLRTSAFPIFYIVSFQPKLCQITFHTFSPRFSWTTLLPFPTSMAGITVSTYDITIECMNTQLCILTSSILTATPTRSLRTALQTSSINPTKHIILIKRNYTLHILNLSSTVSS